MDEMRALDAQYDADHRVMRSIMDRCQGLYDALFLTGQTWRELRDAGDVAGFEAVTRVEVAIYARLAKLNAEHAELQARTRANFDEWRKRLEATP